MTAKNYMLGLIAGLGLMTMGAGQNIDLPLKFYMPLVEEMNSKGHYQKLTDKRFLQDQDKYKFAAKRNERNYILITEDKVGFSAKRNEEFSGVLIINDPKTPYLDQIRIGGDKKSDAFLVYVDNEWKLSINSPFGPMPPVSIEQSEELKQFVKKAEEAYKKGRRYADENIGKIDNTADAVNFHKR